jgi:hypothetical protein
MVQARVADHDPGDRPRVLEVGCRAAEAPGVLIDVEQQHHAAIQAVRGVAEADGDVGEDRGSRFRIG